MKSLLSVKLSGILILLWAGNAVSGITFEQQYNLLHQQWAEVNYTLSNFEQTKAYALLVRRVKKLVAQHPHRAESFLLLGQVESNYAPLLGGTAALSISKDAKKSLERSLHIDDSVVDGLAYTLLGALYHNVPKWPLGFGNSKKAHLFLEKALNINPDGLELNYLFAELLFDEQEYEKAKRHLVKAINSKNYLGSQMEIESRRAQSRDLLRKVNIILDDDISI